MFAKQFFPVKFTQSQRKVIAELFPGLADRLRVDEKNQRVVSFTMNELQDIQEKTKATHGQAQKGNAAELASACHRHCCPSH